MKMYHKVKFITCLSTSVLLCSNAGATKFDEPYFTNISVKDGLSQSVVYCISQDSQGFMWFGTGNGVNRFDGYDFTVFKNDKNNDSTISHNLINCITEDNEGHLWIGTGDGLNRFDSQSETFTRYHNSSVNNNSLGNNYIKSLLFDSKSRLWIGADGCLDLYSSTNDDFTHYDFDGLLKNTRIFSILEDHLGHIWLATRDVGLIMFDPETDDYRHFSHVPSDPHSISSDHTYFLYEDSRRNLWIATWEYGLNVFDRDNGRFNAIQSKKNGLSLNNNQIRCVSENNDGRIWIGTFEGLNIFTPECGSFNYYLRHNNVPGTLSNNIVNCIYKDKSGSVWLGTNGGGVNLYNPSLGQFKLIDPKMLANHDYGYIGPMAEYDGKIWIGTEGGGLSSYDPASKKYNYYDIRNPRQTDMSSNTIKALCVDHRGLIWIGTYAAGIQTFNPKSLSFEKYYDSPNGINNNIINEIFEDRNGNIWVGSNNAEVHIKDRYSDKFIAEFEIKSNRQRADFPWIRTICEMESGELWFGSIYNGLFIYRPGHETLEISSANSDLSSDYISYIMEDSKKQVWIGTYGGGVNIYDKKSGNFTVYNTSNGLLNDNVCCIIEDSLSNIWISTLAGISSYNPDDNSFSNYSYPRGNFPIETMNLKSGLYGSDGNIYFGGSNGIAYFSPKEISRNPEIPSVVITGLYVDNKPVKSADGSGILDKAIQHTHKIVLKHNQTDLSIEFAALNYIYPQNNQYSFYMEGYDKTWSSPGYQRQAIYTNLPHGNYNFRIKASNNSGIWNESGIQLSIQILPPPWKTWWAYCFYVVFCAAVLLTIIRYSLSRIKLQNDIKLKQLEKQTLEQTHRMQLNLFTNFSHELRTPLTLILGPLKSMLSNPGMPEIFREPLTLIHKNADRILFLVNQLMDYRKKESGQMKVRLSEGNIIGFLNEIVIIFRELTMQKNIRLLFHYTDPDIKFNFDPFLLEKVLFNILSNAVKNTPSNGVIQVAVGLRSLSRVNRDLRANDIKEPAQAKSYLTIIVKDTGPGIPPADLKKIFDPFFRVNEYDIDGNHGTGIGLHITKSIIDLHHGAIWAENNPKKGSSFHIVFPVDKSLYEPEDFATGEKEYIQSQDAVAVEKPPKATSPGKKEENKKNQTHKILIIDDNADVRGYIAASLKNLYVIYESENGIHGLQMAQNIMPDLIISDIMMPGMDGLELSRKLKSDIKTSHIPIILLTARTSLAQIQEGLDTGADDYITKPFEADLLKIKLHNIIENRKRLKETYIKSFNLDLSNKEINNTDEIFLSRAYEYVKENLGNPDLSIEEFGAKLQLSRTQLYRKIKALTGMSPSLFVSTLRLKVAAELLVETHLSVSEIAYKVGFGTPSYFTTSFKKLYGTSPKEYLARNKML